MSARDHWRYTRRQEGIVGLADGIRESAQSWKELLLDLKRRGLTIGPQLAVADGALGFWKAIDEVWPKTRTQRCWVHKTANVLNKLPKSLQAKAKRALQDIWMAETRKAAEAAFDGFIECYGVDVPVLWGVLPRFPDLANREFARSHLDRGPLSAGWHLEGSSRPYSSSAMRIFPEYGLPRPTTWRGDHCSLR